MPDLSSSRRSPAAGHSGPGSIRRHAESLVWLGSLLLLLGGCSALRRPDPVIDRTEDPRILNEVAARLAAEPSIGAGRIRVEVDGALVLLYGSVEGIGAWNCALRDAQLVPGVRSVVDYLVIERGDRDIVCLAPTTFGS